jgi:hypothetical protein
MEEAKDPLNSAGILNVLDDVPHLAEQANHFFVPP